MEKNYGINPSKRNLEVKRIQVEKLLQLHSPLRNKKDRSELKKLYSLNFKDKSSSFSTKAPKNTNHKPTYLIIHELLSKEKIEELIDGLNVLSNLYSNTGLIGGRLRLNQDTLEHIKQLQLALFEGESLNLKYFSVPQTLTEFEYFNLYLHNFSSSYFLLEFRIKLKDDFCTSISNFALDSYSGERIISTYKFVNGKRKNSFVMNLPASGKRRDWFEKIAIVKWKFLNFISEEVGLSLFFSNKASQLRVF